MFNREQSQYRFTISPQHVGISCFRKKKNTNWCSEMTTKRVEKIGNLSNYVGEFFMNLN